MQKIINRGFTLIELLVVIAIIGILASIVLVSLGNARQKGADAGIQGNLDSIRTQAELYASSNTSTVVGQVGYGTLATTTVATGGTCAAANTMWNSSPISSAVSAALAQAGAGTISGVSDKLAVCGSTEDKGWAMAVVLKTNTTKAWCVDSYGVAKQIDTAAIPTPVSNFARCP